MSAVFQWQTQQIDRALGLVLKHFAINLVAPEDIARVERRSIQTQTIPTQEIAVDGEPVWRLRWLHDGAVISGHAEWVGPLASCQERATGPVVIAT